MIFLLSQLFILMTLWVPPDSDVDRDRYQAIAQDALAVAFDRREVPLDGTDRLGTAVQLLSTASYESGFREDIDRGQTLGDHGQAYCLMQIHPGPGIVLTHNAFRYARTGWHGKDLTSDRKKCFRVALRMMRESLMRCGNLSLYTVGRCDSREPKAKMHRERAKIR